MNGMKKPRGQVSKELREQIIDYFYKTHNNTDQAIANVFGLDRMAVSDIIAYHLHKKMKRINKEIDNRLKQRHEPKQNNQDTLKS